MIFNMINSEYALVLCCVCIGVLCFYVLVSLYYDDKIFVSLFNPTLEHLGFRPTRDSIEFAMKSHELTHLIL